MKQQHNRLHIVCTAILLTVLLSAVAHPLYAQWTPDGVQLPCESPYRLLLVTDRAGGAYVVYDEWGSVYTQHIDDEGYWTFPGYGISVTDEASNHSNFLMGASSTPDGGVSIAFNNYSIDPENLWSIYGQKITIEGERAFGPEGVLVSGRDFHQIQSEWMFPGAITDSSGGFWAYYYEPGSSNKWVCGMNEDGTPKGDVLFHEGGIDINGIWLYPDGSGGVYVIWHYFENSNRDIYLQRVNAEGEVVFENPIVELDDPFGINLVTIAPHPDGGLYLLNSHGVYLLQRLSEQGERLFGDCGIESPFVIEHGVSNPVVMQDSSVAFLATTAYYQPNHPEGWLTGTHLLRYNPDGTQYFETETVQVDTCDTLRFGTSYLFLYRDPASDTLYGFGTIAYSPGTGYQQHIMRGLKITPSGENIWQFSPHYITNFPDGHRISHPQFVVTPDTSFIWYMTVEDFRVNPTIFYYYVYKFSKDGQVSGSEST